MLDAVPNIVYALDFFTKNKQKKGILYVNGVHRFRSTDSVVTSISEMEQKIRTLLEGNGHFKDALLKSKSSKPLHHNLKTKWFQIICEKRSIIIDICLF